MPVVQAVSAQGVGATSVTAPSFNSSSGNLLVTNCTDDQNDTTEVAQPVGDNAGSTWRIGVALRLAAGGFVRFSQRYAAGIIGTTGHVVTYSKSTSGFPTICVVEISGADSNPLDKAASNDATNAANPHLSGTTAATALADEIAVAGMTHNGGGSETFASNNSYVIQTSQTNTANMPGVLSTKIVAATGAQSESYNLTANNSVNYVAGVATYMLGAVAGGVIPAEGRRPASLRAFRMIHRRRSGNFDPGTTQDLTAGITYGYGSN